MRTRASNERLTDWFARFRQWRAPLRKFLSTRWSLNASDFDDVAQEVFLRLLRYDNSELIEHPQAYLFRMASNVAGEWALRSRHRHPHDARWLVDLCATSDPEREVAQQTANEQLRRAIAGLPPRQREVVRLHFAEGLPRAQIAERLETSERVVKRDLINAYSSLRTVLDTEIADELNFQTGNVYGPE
jgi:RNA polymerase sigma-70 factor (ECF subfamily)